MRYQRPEIFFIGNCKIIEGKGKNDTGKFVTYILAWNDGFLGIYKTVAKEGKEEGIG